MTSLRTERLLPSLLSPDIECAEEQGGGLRLRSRTALRPTGLHQTDWLSRAAEQSPRRYAFVEFHSASRWTSIDWSEAYARSRSIAQALLDRGVSLERPLMILSENSIDHALLTLGAAWAGVPVVPVSAAYSLKNEAHGTLKDIAALTTPGLVFVEDADRYRSALEALTDFSFETVSGTAVPGVTPIDELRDTTPRSGANISEATKRARGDSVTKILMTSGTTGRPRGVLNTQKMMSRNQDMLSAVYPFLDERPQVLVDWLPWSHTFGGNHNFNMALRSGGTMVIARGRPGNFEPVLGALRRWSPTFYLDVPLGWSSIADALEGDRELRQSFFSRLSGMFYAGAPLAQDIWKRLDAIALKHLGVRHWLTTGWGATETSPMSTASHFSSDRADTIGVPAPGVELRLVPHGERYELRVRGEHVTPGYHRDPDATARAFDEEGFFRTMDAGVPVDENAPSRGVRFVGRISEDFKLASGAWVNVGALRRAVIGACEGLLSDVVFRGEDAVVALGWLGAAARNYAEDERFALVRSPALHRALQQALSRYNDSVSGTSRRVSRLVLFDEPPSAARGELTEKGALNFEVVLRLRNERNGVTVELR